MKLEDAKTRARVAFEALWQWCTGNFGGAFLNPETETEEDPPHGDGNVAETEKDHRRTAKTSSSHPST